MRRGAPGRLSRDCRLTRVGRAFVQGDCGYCWYSARYSHVAAVSRAQAAGRLCRCKNQWRHHMTCASSQHSIEAYLDGELATSESAEVREHMDGCPSCAAIYRRLEQLRNDLRMQAPRHTAPAHLQQRIHVALRKAVENEAPHRALPWNSAAVSASLLLCASLSWNFALLRSRGPHTGT